MTQNAHRSHKAHIAQRGHVVHVAQKAPRTCTAHMAQKAHPGRFFKLSNGNGNYKEALRSPPPKLFSIIGGEVGLF